MAFTDNEGFDLGRRLWNSFASVDSLTAQASCRVCQQTDAHAPSGGPGRGNTGSLFQGDQVATTFLFASFQAGVTHVILAVSYRAELMEKELKEHEKRVNINQVS